MLTNRGLDSAEVDGILTQLHKEYTRRMNLGKESIIRRQKIKEMYKRRHPQLYLLQVRFFLEMEYENIIIHLQKTFN